MKMYKYRKIDSFLETNILDSEFVFSRLRVLNDPFETTSRIEFIDQNRNHLSKLDEHVGIEDTKRLTQELLYGMVEYYNSSFRKNIFVGSFSKINSSIPMWAHYADNHKGVCYEFEIDLDEFGKKVIEVEYLETPVPITMDVSSYNPKDKSNDYGLKIVEDESRPLIIKLISKKSIEWSYEQEIRFVSHSTDDISEDRIPLKFLKVKKIYLGVLISNEHETLVRELAAKKNIPVITMMCNFNTYKITPPID